MISYFPGDIWRQICTALEIDDLARLFNCQNRRLQSLLLQPGVISQLDISSWSHEIGTLVYSLNSLTNVRIGRVAANHFIEHLMSNPLEKLEINSALVVVHRILDGVEIKEEEFYVPNVPLIEWTARGFLPDLGRMFPHLNQLRVNHPIDELIREVVGHESNGMKEFQSLVFGLPNDHDDMDFDPEEAPETDEDYEGSEGEDEGYTDNPHSSMHATLDYSREAAVQLFFQSLPRGLELFHLNLELHELSLPKVYFDYSALLYLPYQSLTSLELNFGDSEYAREMRPAYDFDFGNLGRDFPRLVHFAFGLRLVPDRRNRLTIGTRLIPSAPDDWTRELMGYDDLEGEEAWIPEDFRPAPVCVPASAALASASSSSSSAMDLTLDAQGMPSHNQLEPCLESMHFIVPTTGLANIQPSSVPSHLQRLTIEAKQVIANVHPMSFQSPADLEWWVGEPKGVAPFHFPTALLELNLINIVLKPAQFLLLPISLTKLALVTANAGKAGLGLCKSEMHPFPRLLTLRLASGQARQSELSFLPPSVTDLNLDTSMTILALRDEHSAQLASLVHLRRFCGAIISMDLLNDALEAVPKDCHIISSKPIPLYNSVLFPILVAKLRPESSVLCPETVFDALDQHFRYRLTATFKLEEKEVTQTHDMQERLTEALIERLAGTKFTRVSFCRDSPHSNGRLSLTWDHLPPHYFIGIEGVSTLEIESDPPSTAAHNVRLLSWRPEPPPWFLLNTACLTTLCTNIFMPKYVLFDDLPPALVTLRIHGSSEGGFLLNSHGYPQAATLTCLDAPYGTLRPFSECLRQFEVLKFLSIFLEPIRAEVVVEALASYTQLEECYLGGIGIGEASELPLAAPFITEGEDGDARARMIEEAMTAVEWVTLDVALEINKRFEENSETEHMSRDKNLIGKEQ